MSSVSSESQNKTATYSSSPSVSMISSYIKSIFGFNPKVTKRSLSEEAECGSPEVLSEWLRRGADPNEIDAYGYTPLVNASLRGCNKTVRFLLNNGADINKKAIHGYSALHAASQNGHLDVVEILLEHNADKEIRNDDGDTPLMLAVRSEHPAIVDLLCSKGSDIHTMGFDNIDPINYAMNKRNLYMSDVLLKHERHFLNSTSSGASMNDSSFDSSLQTQQSHDSMFASD